jgi:hypothetical protein
MLRLTESGQLKPLSKYEKQVAELMKLVESGQCDAAMEAFEQFKKDYPQIVGPNPNDPNDKTDPKAFDAFVEAEMYLCKRKFARAVRSYDKFLDQYRQTSKFAEVAPDRQLYIAGKFLSGEKRRLLGIFKIRRYAEGVRIIDGIIDRERLDTPIGRKAAKMLAESYEKRGRFEHAYNRWFDIYEEAYNCWSDAGFKLFKLEKRPTDTLRKELLLRQENALLRRKETLLRMARCKHISYRGPKYDTSTLIIARNHYEELITNKDLEKLLSEREKNRIDEEIKKINVQLAYKQFCIGRYYQKTGNKLAANSYYRMVEDNYNLEEGTLDKWHKMYSGK